MSGHLAWNLDSEVFYLGHIFFENLVKSINDLLRKKIKAHLHSCFCKQFQRAHGLLEVHPRVFGPQIKSPGPRKKLENEERKCLIHQTVIYFLV